MQSGGFSPSQLVPQVQVPSLILWGRQDGILDGTEFAPKFLETLPNAELQWVENSGHVPHLEQPDTTADAIQEFVSTLKERAAAGSAGATTKAGAKTPPPQWVVTSGAVVGVSALAAALAADWLPTF